LTITTINGILLSMKNERSPIKGNLTQRQKFFRRGAPVIMAGTALLGVGAAKAGPTLAHEAGNAAYGATVGALLPQPIPTFPKGTEMKTVVVNRIDEGAQEVVLGVEPQIVDYPQLEDQAEDYVNSQGRAADHQLMLDQSVAVPVLVPQNHDTK
jgi:hypothetical protein